MPSCLIEGNLHHDPRGTVRFVNAFNFSGIQRFYTIATQTGQIRAWQGHQRESKWFYISKGSFEIQLIPFEVNVNKLLFGSREHYRISDKESSILHIPGGYLNGLKAMENDSVLTVFSDFNLQESIEDDIRVGLDELPWM